MRYHSTLLALAAIFSISCATLSSPRYHGANIRGRTSDPEVVADSYIVVFKAGANASAILDHEAMVESTMYRRRSYGNGRHNAHHGVHHKFNFKNFNAYSVETDETTIAQIASSPEVDYVERNAVVHTMGKVSQSGANWNLARISHRDKGASNYVYDASACAGTTGYVIDSGIYLEHTQFGGRAIWGSNFVNSVNTDENGHGTHVAGILGGATFGVCKAIELVAVKVVDANGDGTYAGVIAGIQWAVTDAQTKLAVTKSVINLSIAGPYSAAMNAAVAASVAAGITTVVAAGNENYDASNDSPASEPSAITAGAIDITDTRGTSDDGAYGSNYGPDVDIFAPGWGVLSAYIGSPTATMTLDGTSQAAPHVAGVAAYFIAWEGLSTPAEIRSCINAKATSGDVVDAETGSPNLILYNGSGY